MGFWSSVGSIVSSTFSAIGGLAASVASTVIKVATSAEVWQSLGSVVKAVGSVLGVIPSNQTAEKYGERVLSAGAEGITSDSFDSYHEYIAAIRDFELKPELADRWSKEEKIAASAGVVAEGLTELKSFSLNSALSLMILAAQHPTFFNAERVLTLLGKTNDFSLIADYFRDDLDLHDEKKVEALLVDSEQGQVEARAPEDVTATLRQLRAEAE